MTFEEEDKVTGKRNVLVGIGFDGHTSELLDWALVKVADPGDCVVAVHICRNSDSTSKAQSLIDDYLDEYKSLCHQKQVGLAAEVVKGSSIRKLLVREAKKRAAIAVIVGINKNSPLGYRGRVSIAKYCAKKLPFTTEVMAIHNGKVVYRRGSNDHQPAGSQRDPKPSLYLNGDLSFKEYHSEFGDSEISDFGRLSHEVCQSSECGYTEADGNSKGGALISPIQRRKRSSLSSISLPIEDFTQQRPGWPLLQTASTMTQPSLVARKMTVVQWVMSLPNRSLLEVPQALGGTDNVSVSAQLPNDLELLLKTKSPGCKLFSHEILKSSTSQFSSDNLIGKGGCNCVYKGILPDGKPVAVKILKSSKEAWKEFSLEVDIMTTLKHRSITPLLGICIADNDLISVYDFISRGNLEENLHGNEKGRSVLPWEVRFKIAVGVAEALNYLHNECPTPVIHRDIKSSNILLTDGFEPQLSDFGLAMWGPTKASFITDSDIVGTFGYLAPEYFMYGKVSDKVDVYCFGVVLLELLSGRKPIGFDTSKGQESLVLWAKPKLESGDVEGIVDQKLDNNFDESEMQRMVLAAKLCLTQAARRRPKMSQILKILTGEENLGEEISTEVGINPETQGEYDDEVYPVSSAESHLSLALLDVYDNSASFSSQDQSSPLSVEDYLRRRWSRSSSLE